MSDELHLASYKTKDSTRAEQDSTLAATDFYSYIIVR